MMLAVATTLVWTGCEKEVSPQMEPYEVSRKTQNANDENEFNYDTWFDKTNITIYNDGKKKTVALPWAPVSSTSIPDEYEHPEKEYLKDKKTRRWELAFNLCEDEETDGINIFGLWDSRAQTMRVYCYLDELPNENASSCFYQIESTAQNYLDPDTKMWMPSDSIHHCASWKGTISYDLPVPSRTGGRLLPVTGTLDGQVNKGWICFDLHFGSGLTKVKNTDHIVLTMYGVQNLSFTSKIDLTGVMNSTNGSITVPGNDARVASGSLKTAGSFLKDLTESVSSGVEVGKETGLTPLGVATGIVGGIGAVCSLVGECLDISEDKEKADSTQYNLKLGFNISSTGELNGSLKSTLGTNTRPVKIDYEYFFKEILDHHNNSGSGDGLTMGVWNLKNQPVIYVADDFILSEHDTYETIEYYVSFLDPSSLELMLNGDNLLFPLSEVVRVTMRAYDFAFTSEKYDVSPVPYKDFFGIPQETFDASKFRNKEFGSFKRDSFLLKEKPDAKPKSISFERNNKEYNYFGTVSTLDGFGLDAYDLVYSPIIGIRRPLLGWDGMLDFDDLYVAVIIQVDFDSGYSQVFAERFLPVIKSFSYSDVPKLKDRLSKSSAPETVNGIPVEFPLFDMQRDKAVRMLEATPATNTYPSVFIKKAEGDKDVYGLRVRAWTQNAPGIVILPSTDENIAYKVFTHLSALQTLHKYLIELDDWEMIDNRLTELGLSTLNQFFCTEDDYLYHLKTGEGNYGSGDLNKYPCLNMYYEDQNGNLSLAVY